MQKPNPVPQEYGTASATDNPNDPLNDMQMDIESLMFELSNEAGSQDAALATEDLLGELASTNGADWYD